jgi:hypothetical protein
MSERSLILPVCFGVLLLAALAFAVAPALRGGEREAAAVTVEPRQSSGNAGSAGSSLPNALQPADGSAARPTATFPAFAARGGGIYSSDEEAP